jgi:hypothetical protein
MEYPMRRYGTNIFENALSIWLSTASWFCLLLAVASFIFREYFYPSLIFAGFLIASLLASFILLGILSTGTRQYGGLKDCSFFYFMITGLVFL